MSTKTSLFEAVNKNDILTVHSLVQSGACAVNLQDIDGCTPLHMAVRKSYLELTRLLLGQSDCGVNIQDNYGCTPLHEAVEQCYLEIARCILNHNDCDVNVQSRLGDTPLHLAVMNNSSDMVKCILNHNDCRVNIQNNLGSTPLHVAAFNKSIDIVRCLLTRSDLGVNLQNSKGKTPLDVAVMFNNKDIAKCIWSRAALGVNIKTSIGDTPLHVAVLQNNIDNVKCLISEKDCSVNVQNKRGDTPLHLAVLNNNVDIVKCLINQNNYCGNRQNRRGDTPLHSAVLNNNADIVKCLINQKDCSGNIQNKKGYTPLHIAVLYNNKEIVKCLIHRPDCGDNIKNKRGHTPLHLAVLDNNTEIVKCLMSSSNISRDNLDYTPLHTAVKESKIEIICCLIEEGNYDINMKNEEGFSPFSTTSGLQTLHKIAKDKNVELVRVLNKHNVDVLSNHVNNQLQLVKFILSENDIESLRFLIHQNGLYINSLSSSGENIVHLFAKFYMDYLFKDFSFLLNYGLDFNLLNNDGSSPLMVASYLNNFPFIQFLASTHCDVNIQNHEGHTALHLCVIGLTLMEDKLRRIKSISVVRRLCANEYYPRYLECIDILLDLGADVDIKDKCGRTVVMLACMKNDKILLKKLILAGADVNIKDTHGRCALQYLDLKNLYDLTCINLLLSHGCRQSFNQPCLNGNTVVQNVLKFKPLLQHSVITDFIKFLVYKNVNLQVLISDDEKSPLSQLSLLRFSSESRQELRQILYLSGGPFEQITRILNFEVEENYEALLPETLKENPREKFHIFANNLSLQEICRRVIRQNIGLAIHGWITKLLDVQILADFLMFKDEDSKRFSLPEQLCSRTDDDDYDVYNIEDDYKNDYLVYEDITYLNEVQAGLEKFSKSSDLDSNSDSTSYSDLDSDLDSNSDSTSYSDSDLDLNSDSTSYSDLDLNSDLDSLSGLDSN